MPTIVISKPDAHQERIVMSDLTAPTAKCARMLMTNAAMTAGNPLMKKKGMIGMKAPTAVGAFIPIIPFFFMSGFPAVIAAFVISILAHFAVGAVKSLITIRSWWASGFEMTIVGIIEAVVTYGLGLAFGALG